jgi:hypothetical protein
MVNGKMVNGHLLGSLRREGVVYSPFTIHH